MMKLAPLKQRIIKARSKYNRARKKADSVPYLDELYEIMDSAFRNYENLVELRDRLEREAFIKRVAKLRKPVKVCTS